MSFNCCVFCRFTELSSCKSLRCIHARPKTGSVDAGSCDPSPRPPPVPPQPPPVPSPQLTLDPPTPSDDGTHAATGHAAHATPPPSTLHARSNAAHASSPRHHGWTRTSLCVS